MLLFITTWTDFQGMMLGEIRQRQRLYDLIYMWNLTKSNSQQQRVEWWLPDDGGDRVMLVKGYKLTSLTFPLHYR